MGLLEKALAYKGPRASRQSTADERRLAVAALRGDISPSQLSAAYGYAGGRCAGSAQGRAFRVLCQMYADGLIRINEASASPISIHARKRA